MDLFLQTERGAHDLIHGRDTGRGELDAATTQTLITDLRASGGSELHRVARVHRVDQRFVHLQVLEDADATEIARGIAVRAAASALELQLIGGTTHLRAQNG